VSVSQHDPATSGDGEPADPATAHAEPGGPASGDHWRGAASPVDFLPNDPTWIPPAPPEPAPPRGREALVCLAAAIVIAGLGAPLGLLWQTIAPRVELVQTDFGPYPLQPQPEQYVADDGWFIGLSAVAGLLVAILVWVLLRRYRGATMLLALVAGSIGGAALAAWLGSRIGLAEYERLVQQAENGATILRPARLRLADVGLWFGVLPRVRGTVLVQALVAAGMYTALAGFSPSSTLRGGDEYEYQEDGWTDARGEPHGEHPSAGTPISSDWSPSQTPPMMPAPPGPDAAAPPPGAAPSARPSGE
jgi:hypothetical protein